MKQADLRIEIGTTMSTIIKLLSNSNSGVCQASANAISKFAEHGETGLLGVNFVDYESRQSLH